MSQNIQLNTTPTKTFNRPSDVLRVPFFLDTTKISVDEVNKLIDRFESVLGAEYLFNNRDVLEEVFNEYHIKATKPFQHHRSYIGVVNHRSERLIIKAVNDISDLGCTVYAADQITEILDIIEAA